MPNAANKQSCGDAHIEFTEEVTPDKGSLNKLAKTFIPFVLLFLTKFIFQHFNYGLILLGLNLLAVRVNQFITRQIQLKRNFSPWKCTYTVVLITSITLMSFNSFAEFEIWRVLVGKPITDSKADSFSWMVWLVLYADTILKLITMSVKLVSIQFGIFMCLFKRGCLLSVIELLSSIYRHLAGFQLIPFIMASENNSSSELYLSYLLLAAFFLVKLFAVYGIFKQLKGVCLLFLRIPKFGIKSRETISCDLSQKTECLDIIKITNHNGEIGYCEDDFLHYLVTFGSDPDTGHPMLNVPGGDGRTNLMVNIF